MSRYAFYTAYAYSEISQQLRNFFVKHFCNCLAFAKNNCHCLVSVRFSSQLNTSWGLCCSDYILCRKSARSHWFFFFFWRMDWMHSSFPITILKWLIQATFFTRSLCANSIWCACQGNGTYHREFSFNSIQSTAFFIQSCLWYRSNVLFYEVSPVAALSKYTSEQNDGFPGAPFVVPWKVRKTSVNTSSNFQFRSTIQLEG